MIFATAFRTILILFTCALLTSANAQEYTNEGTDFWFAFPLLTDQGSLGSSTYEVSIVSDLPAAGFITADSNFFPTTPALSIPFYVTPGIVTTVSIPNDNAYNPAQSFVWAAFTGHSFHLTADTPVAVFASKTTFSQPAVSSIMPTNALGSSYMVTSKPAYGNASSAGIIPQRPSVAVVATGSPLSVIVTSPRDIIANWPAPYTYHLQAGVPDTVDIAAKGVLIIRTETGGQELTGVTIEATNGTDKFAVYSGHAFNKKDLHTGDPMFELEYPIDNWGTEYIISPIPDSLISDYRVLAMSNGTNVFVDGVLDTTLNQGEFYGDTITTTKVITGSNPIKVSYFTANRFNYGAATPYNPGDNSMIHMVPNSKMLTDTTRFFHFRADRMDSSFVKVITRTADIATVAIDGVPITSWTAVPSLLTYSYSLTKIDTGAFELTTTGCGFIAYVHGIGQYESYSYAIGTFLEKDSIQIANVTTGNNAVLCVDDSIQFTESTDGNIVSYLWDFGDLTTSALSNPIHAYSAANTYPVSVILTYNCFSDTLLDTIVIQHCCLTDTIGFTYTYPDPCDSTIVEFTANSTGQMDSIWWSMGFPGGSGLVDTITTVNFPNAQTYNINLWIYGACGWTDTTQQITTPSLPAYNYELMNHNKNYCTGDPVDTLFVVDTSGNGGIINWYDDAALMNNVGTGLYLIPQSSIGVYTYYITETLPCGERTLDSVNIEIINCVGCFGNLIPNPGFETYSTCYGSSIAGGFVTGPGNHMLHLATPWSNPAPAPDTANADYLNTCAEVLTDVPHTGNGYAGLVIFSQDCEYREYLQAPLNQSLLSGRCYQASMHIQVYTSSSANIDSVGMYFSAGAPVQGDPICPTGFGVPGQGLINVNPQITNDPTVDMTAYDWQLVTGTFIATGGEDYITIGNFAPDLNLNPQYFGPLPNRLAYYLVDDVCLYEIPPDTIDVNVTDTVTCSSVALTGPIGYDLYYWYDSTNTLASNTQFLNVTSLGTNTYVLYSLDTSMCPHTYYRDTLTVTINNIPSAGINDSVSYCSSGAAADLFTLLGGLPDTGGAWTPPMSSGTGIFDPATDAPGTYTYTIIDSCGTDSAYVVVTVHSVSSTTSVASICQGDSMFLEGSYQTTPGTYIDLFTVNGCDSTAETTLTVFPMADATIISDSVFCENDPATNLLAASSGGLWSGTGITNASVGTFDPGLASSGDHVVTYGIDGFCGDTVSATIRVNESPGIAVSSADDSCLLANGSIDLEITGGIVPYSYLWNNSSIAEDLTALSSGTYTVVVTDSMGCSRSETIMIQENMLNCSGNLWLPNIFSPNNDQLNDVLYVRGAETAQSFVFMIYNRWGEKVFETTEHTVGWDGTHRGEPLNSAVFAYLVTATFIDGTEAILNGTVTLVR